MLAGCFEREADLLIIGHRGAAGHAPEHTFASWDLALEMGVDYIEQDLQMTADGQLVVLHDETLDRTARGQNCTGPVIAHALTDLAGCDVGTWFNDARPDRARAEFAGARIPTLDSVFSRYAGRARFYIETKNPETAPGMEEALIALLEKHDLLPARADDDRVIIHSFSAARLRRVRSLHATIPLVHLHARAQTADSIRAQLNGLAEFAQGIGPHYSDVDSALVASAHALGLVIHPYTVNAPAEMRRLIELGVDGMFTDYPDILRGVLVR
jgi:glycerophosphoryl diester phosphodiesterase